MRTAATSVGLIVLAVILWEIFETIVLPRTVTRELRLTRVFYRSSWELWAKISGRLRKNERRAGFLGVYGPISLLLLLALWAVCLMFAFALLQWGLDTVRGAAGLGTSFGTSLYFSGVTLFTLGFGDVVPRTSLGRAIAVIEGGVGIGFLAIVIGYLPVLYQAFSRREVGISLLDARAGSPPSAVELLRRHAAAGQMSALIPLLQEWERWAAELLESHLSYPVLMYYRSQHDRESWLAALTSVLDVCAMVQGGFEDGSAMGNEGPALEWQSRMTYAMARHAVVDLTLIVDASPVAPAQDRVSSEEWARICASLERSGLRLPNPLERRESLAQIRRDYEPYVNALALRLLVALPPFLATEDLADNWQTSAWQEAPHF